MHLNDFWQSCLVRLQSELSPQQFNTWIRTLTVDEDDEVWVVFVPNRFMLQFIKERFFDLIVAIAKELAPDAPVLELRVGEGRIKATGMFIAENNVAVVVPKVKKKPPFAMMPSGSTVTKTPIGSIGQGHEKTRLNLNYTFDSLVTGKGNQLARAAALQISENPGDSAYNPLFLYGSTGLGKTHLIQALGNRIHQLNPNVAIRYIHAERYVSDIMKAFREKSFDNFKQHYHSLDLLLIDDIQFFAGKNRTMEEFFYAFNALLDAKKQVVITCDTYPSQIEGMDDRLKSRFSWGLTVEIQPPELEMRVAILLQKAEAENTTIAQDAAFFIAQNIRSNVRELEGAFKRVLAVSRFESTPITLELVKTALQDILAVTQRQITVTSIQKTVADYYHIKFADMVSKKRTRAIARPRQMAMTLAKELTQLSLPSIGEAFGGRDHTTVLHAYRTIFELKQSNDELAQDFESLVTMLRN